MRVLITGGAGFIGSNLARRALEDGHEVRVLDDMSTGFEGNLAGMDLEVLRGAVQDPIVTARAVANTDTIIHLGALGSVPRSIQDPLASHHANATGTLTLLDLARRADVPHVVCASSSSVYGMNPALPKSEREWVRPMSPYAVTKLATEQYTLAFQQSYGLATTAFRFFNVYGPGQRAGNAYAAVIPTWIDAALRGQPITVNGDGKTSRDFTFVSTVCDVLLSTIDQRLTHAEPVNLALATNTTLLELADTLGETLNTQLEINYAPPRPGDVSHSQADPSSLRRLFPEVRAVPLKDGLAETVAWFVKQVQDTQT